MEDTEKTKFRSPQFPFIPLDKAVERSREFEAQYGMNAGRPTNVVKTWGYSEKSSGGIQTVAALSAFGLLEDEGGGDQRKLRLSPLAMTVIKDKRPGALSSALKVAALKPKIMSELWSEWGANRPPDHECQSSLQLDKKFAEDAAVRLVRIYDSTIRYANLAEADKKIDNDGTGEEVKIDTGKGQSVDELKGSPPPLPPPPPPLGEQSSKVQIMENERILYAHNITPQQGFKVIVFGDVDKELAGALEAFAKFQVTLAKPAGDKSGGTQ